MAQQPNDHILGRSALRDVVLLCSFVSALIFSPGAVQIIVGFSLLTIGSFLHVVAKGILVRNTVLCNKGIYGIVRHPYYFANYLVDVSFCVLSGNLYLLLAYPFLFFWSYGPTLRKEEMLLDERHGDAFRSDSLRIPQIFPDAGSFPRWREIFDGFSVDRVTLKERSRIARFCSLGFAIVAIHALKPFNLSGFRHLFVPTANDYDQFVFALLMVILYMVSSLLLRASLNSRVAGGNTTTGAFWRS